MAVDIGGVSCDMVKGLAQSAKLKTDAWTTPGIDGYGVLVLGEGDSVFQLMGIKYDTDANIDTWFNSIEALQGTIITATNDHGDSLSSLICLQANRVSKKAVKYQGNDRVRGVVSVSGVVDS